MELDEQIHDFKSASEKALSNQNIIVGLYLKIVSEHEDNESVPMK